MATSSTNSWLHSTLLSHAAQQPSAQHALYAVDLPMQHSSSHLGQQHHMGLVPQDHQQHLSCDSFCPPLHHPLNTGFHQPAESQQLHDFNGAAGGSGRVNTATDNTSQLSARKVHKADREKLRRDRLNEQFAELAGVLDPDRPKNDKATILGDSVQVVKELRAEVKRLRIEHTSLLDESRDLAQEKTELREEKATLKNETEHLQTQLQQRLRIMMPWLGMDPSLMMGAAPYGYPMAVPQAVSGPPPPPEANQSSTPAAVPSSVVAPAGYIPMPPTAASAFVHPALQAYGMFANRPGETGAPFIPYPHYPPPPPPQVNSHSHVERPYAQYPSPVQPLPAYLMQMQPHQSQTPISGAAPIPPMYRSYAPAMPVMAPQPQANQPNAQARADQLPVATYAHYPTSALQPFSGPSQSPQSSPAQAVQTNLQLQTPAQPQPQRAPPDSPDNSTEVSSKAQTGGSVSASSGENTESKQVVAGSDSIASSPAALAPAASTSSPGEGGDGGSSQGLRTGSGAKDKEGTSGKPPVK